MIRIMADSSAIYSKEDGEKKGIIILPLSVKINDEIYKENIDIDTIQVIERINEGNIVTQLHPSIAEILEVYDTYDCDEIINITMAGGLSASYSCACSARDIARNYQEIDVINSETIWGAHRYLVDLALNLLEEGKNRAQIVNELNYSIKESESFFIVKDFKYFIRSKKISYAKGSFMNIMGTVPVLSLSKDKRSVVEVLSKNTFKKAIKNLVEIIKSKGNYSNYKFYISHGYNNEWANEAKDIIIDNIKNADIEINVLSPYFVAVGGLGCILIQYIKKHDILL